MKRKSARIAALGIVFALILAASGCSASRTITRSLGVGKLSVVTDLFAAYDFAREIAGDEADLTLLLAPGEDWHSYSPSPSDLAAIQSCDVFICSGSEAWLDDAMAVADGVLVISFVSNDELNASESDDAPYNDEHVWTSLRNASAMVWEITDALSRSDPRNTPVFVANAEKYVEQLVALDAELRDIVRDSARRTIVVCDPFPLLYFISDYGLDAVAAFDACPTYYEDDETPAIIAFLAESVTREAISVVFVTEMSDRIIAEVVSAETGAEIRVFESCHRVPESDIDYLSLMRQNAEYIREALK